jgi:hypothetical protein
VKTALCDASGHPRSSGAVTSMGCSGRRLPLQLRWKSRLDGGPLAAARHFSGSKVAQLK